MKEIKTQGKFRKSKAYGLVGCLALFSVMVASPVINVKAEESNSNVSSTTTVTGKGHLDTEPYTTTSYKEGMEISKDPGDKYGYFTDLIINPNTFLNTNISMKMVQLHINTLKLGQ